VTDRQWIIDLVREKYDKAPADYRVGDNWDDGAEIIAAEILKAIADQREYVLRLERLLNEAATDRDRLRDELRKVHNERADGEHCFVGHNREKIGVRVQGPRVTVFERREHADYAAMQVSPEDWNAQS
jgi:hypothetical protein